MQINLKINKNRNSDSPLQKNGVPIFVHGAVPHSPLQPAWSFTSLVSIPVPPSITRY